MKRKSNTEPALSGWHAQVARLRGGETISFREKGHSMEPHIKDRQLCTYAPVLAPEDVAVGDYVFCHVGRWHLTHMVSAVRGDGDARRYRISNARGIVNGWIPLSRIFGKVVAIDD